MSEDRNKLVRRNVVLDKETEDAIEQYRVDNSLDNRSQAIRHKFKNNSRNNEANRVAKKEGS